jgi:predicted transcriptional regulator
MAGKTVLAFRIRDDLRKALAQLAKKDRRTVSQYLENVVEDHILAASKGSAEPKGTEGKPARR